MAELVLRRIGTGNFIVESGREILGTKPDIKETELNSFDIISTTYIETVQSNPLKNKYEIEINTGEAFIGGRWIAVDNVTTHTITTEDKSKLFLTIDIPNESVNLVAKKSTDNPREVVLYGALQIQDNNELNIVEYERQYIPRADRRTSIQSHNHGLNSEDDLLTTANSNKITSSYLPVNNTQVIRFTGVATDVNANSKETVDLSGLTDSSDNRVIADLGTNLQNEQTDLSQLSVSVTSTNPPKITFTNNRNSDTVMSATIFVFATD